MFFPLCSFNNLSFFHIYKCEKSTAKLHLLNLHPICVSQVQQWSGVWYRCHVGLSGAADKDSAADHRSDDHRQPTDWRSTDPAGGGRLTLM